MANLLLFTLVLYYLHQCYIIYISVILFTSVLYYLHQCKMVTAKYKISFE